MSERKIVEYILVSHPNCAFESQQVSAIDYFQSEVNRAIDLNGLQPYGNPFELRGLLYQAMVKYED